MINLTPELAEIAGMHAGDGYLRYEGKRKEFDISGGYEERGYYDNHVIPLFNKIFGLSIQGRFFPSRRTYGFRTGNKEVIKSLIELNFPSGKKTTIVSIPQNIINHKHKLIIIAFLRGYFDTDGCVTFDKKIGNSSAFKKKYNYYPRIMFTTCSKNLKDGIIKLLFDLNIVCKWYPYQSKVKTESLKYKLQITGNVGVLRWMELIGSKNHNKISRYLIWKKFGFCPPNTTYQQRINILEGKLNPYSLY